MAGTFWNEGIETMSAPERATSGGRPARRADRLRLRDQPVLSRRGSTPPASGRRHPAPRGPRADPVHGEDRDRRVAGGRRAPRRQPVRADRRDRPDPGDRRHDRPADADRADAARHRRLRRDGRAGAVGDGLPAGRHRVRVHELQPLLRRPQRPPDVRDARRGDDPVRCRSERAAAHDDGRHRRPGRHLGDAVVRRPARRGGAPGSASTRDRSGFAKGYFSGEAGLQVPGYRERIEETWGMVARDQYGTGELGLHSGECEERDGRALRRHRLRGRRADRSRHRRRPAVRGRPAGRGRLHVDPARGVPAPADALARPDAGVHRAVRLRADGLPVPDPRSVGRHVHRQGRERLPARRSRRCSAARPAGHRRVPGRPRPSAADRLSRCRSRSRSRATCPPRRYDELARRGRRAAPGRAELHGRRQPGPAERRHHRRRKTRRVVRSYRGEVE